MKTMQESLGIKDGKLNLNSAQTAACAVCGRPARRHETTTPSGLVVVVHIPTEHACRGSARSPLASAEAQR